MKVLMLNTFDQVGGAARSAARLQRGLRELGIAAKLLVQFKDGTDAGVICTAGPLAKMWRRLKNYLGLLPVRRYANRPENNFSPAQLPDSVARDMAGIDPDIIHLHWLCASFLQAETVGKLGQLGKPIVWTLHDSWPFTGGCHVPFECRRYQQRCGACPVLGSTRENDLSRNVWERKARAWRDLEPTLVAPSRWLADCARSSSLFRKARIEVIPNGVDTEIFQPRGREYSRNLLGLPLDRKIILFGAMGATTDPNKGYSTLARALQVHAKVSSDSLAVVFGCEKAEEKSDLGLPVIHLGRIDDDDRLSAVYSAADVFVAPSKLENLPNTVMEAMACGTPCVAFRQGGVSDLVEHQKCGYLAEPYDVEGLARGIAWVLADPHLQEELSDRARLKVVTEFGLAKMTERYSHLYREVLEKSRNIYSQG